MAEHQNGKSKVRIPTGWEQRGKGFYCRDTEQEFRTLDALLAYVTYARVFQPELFDSWSDKQSLKQNKRRRKREDAEILSGVSLSACPPVQWISKEGRSNQERTYVQHYQDAS